MNKWSKRGFRRTRDRYSDIILQLIDEKIQDLEEKIEQLKEYRKRILIKEKVTSGDVRTAHQILNEINNVGTIKKNSHAEPLIIPKRKPVRREPMIVPSRLQRVCDNICDHRSVSTTNRQRHIEHRNKG